MLHSIIVFSLLHASINFLSPPGTRRVGDNFYIDQNVITNQDWKEFLYFMQKDSPSFDITLMIPDTTASIMSGLGCYSQKTYSSMPLTGVSKKQVLKYCQWRSAYVSYHKNNFVEGSCSNSYWIDIQKNDPDKKYEVIYQPARSDITQHKQIKHAKYIDAEYVTDPSGRLIALPYKAKEKASTKIGFRCMAQYRLIE